jgi:hypothetical protein
LKRLVLFLFNIWLHQAKRKADSETPSY